MANVRISQLPAAPAPIDGSELVPIVQNGQTVQTTVNDLISSPTLTQTFLTKVQEPSLPNSRYLGVGSGLSISDAGAQNLLQISPSGALASLVNSGTGIQVKTDATTLTNRSIATSGNGLSISNGSGVSGNPTLALSGLPATLANTVGTGLLAIGSSTTLTPVTITGTSDQISVSNGNGSGGNPTIGIASNPIIPGSAAMQIPSGTTGQRPSGINGQIRYNTTTGRFEFFDDGSWVNVGIGDGTISSVAGTANQIVVVNGSTAPVISIDPDPTIPGTAGMVVPFGTTAERSAGPNGTFRYNTDTETFEGYANGVWGSIAVGVGVTSVDTGTGLTGGPITSTGTISIANTGVVAGTYGNGTNVAQIAINAQGQITLATNVAITASGLGAITAVNGTSNEITTSQVGTVVTVSLPSALTFTGKTITGGTYTGASISGSTSTLSNIGNSSLVNSSITIGADTVALGGTLSTLQGVSISGSINTLTNIGNSSLTNSAITIGSNSVSLGGTLSTFNGVSISGSVNTLTNIGNSSLTNSSLTIGTTNIALGATSLTLAGLTSVTVTQDPVSDLQLATKQYVDNIAQGLNAKAACVYGTTGDITLSGLSTQAGGDWATSLTAGDRILVKNQSSSQFNGIYIAAAGTWSRSADMNTWTEVPSSFVFIQDGTTLADTGWVTTANAGGTIDVTPMLWVQFSGAGTYTAGTGLTLAGTQFSITNTAVTAASYGSASQVATFTVNAQGQLTAASNTTISIAASQINTTIPNSGLTNSSITIGSTSVSLGSTISTFTGVSISGSTNTLSNIGNSSLTNSSITIGSTSVSLGGTISTFTGVSISGSTNTLSNIGNSSLTNSSITINGSSVSLGGSVTVTATASNALTIGTGLSGTSYDGSTPVTIAISNTGVVAASYGAASKTLTATVNAQGQLTALAETSIAIANTQVSGLGTMSTQNANSVAISGGNIDGTIIGATTAAAITGTTITATKYIGVSGGTF